MMKKVTSILLILVKTILIFRILSELLHAGFYYIGHPRPYCDVQQISGFLTFIGLYIYYIKKHSRKL